MQTLNEWWLLFFWPIVLPSNCLARIVHWIGARWWWWCWWRQWWCSSFVPVNWASESSQWVEPVNCLPPSSFQQFLKCCCSNVTFTWCKGTNCFDVFSCGFASVFLLSLDFIDDFKRSSFSFCSGRLSADNSPFVLVGFFGSVWIDLSFFALGFFLGGGLKLF